MEGTLKEVVDTLERIAHESGLEAPEFSTDIEYGLYGDRDRDVLVLSGWRDATEDEIEEQEALIRQQQERLAEMESRQIQELRRKRPDLFK